MGWEMHFATHILYRMEAIHKDMTDLILRQTGVSTDKVHSKNGKSSGNLLENKRVE